MTRALNLTKGYVALVDDADYAALSCWKWGYLPRSNGRGGYAARWETRDGQRRTIYMHRQIMDAPAGVLVDHEDGDGLNNQRYNLRLASESTNGVNRATQPRAIPYRGVYPNRNGRRAPWIAQIKWSQRSFHLGAHLTQEAAALVYDRAALHFFGSFARLNFPDAAEATRALPLPRAIARLVDPTRQLALPFDDDLVDFPAPPALRPDWQEIQTLRRWSQARAVGGTIAGLDDPNCDIPF